jgi:hypothetical protein
VTTATQFTQAALILKEGAEARSLPPASTVNNLQILAEEIYISRWLAGGIVAEISEWLLGHIGPFQDVLDSLAGDPAAITAQSQAVSRFADAVTGSAGQEVAEGERISRQHWNGPAAEAFALVDAALEHCLTAYGSSARVMASGELVVGERVGAVRQYVTDTCGDMFSQLITEALRVSPWVVFKGAAAIMEFKAWASEFISEYLQNVIQVMQELLADVTGVLGQVKGVGDCMERAASVLEGHGDPGPVSALNPNKSAAKYLGRNPNPEDRNFAETCDGIDSNPATDAAYIGKTFGGYTRLSDEEVRALDIDPALLRDPATGFAAGIFKKGDEYVVAITGTDFGTSQDVNEDATGAVTMSPQSQNAVRLAQAVNASAISDDSVYVGHSLGGRLAAVASMESGNPAITFNAAGVSPATVAYMASEQGISTADMYAKLRNGQVREYSTADDPLTNIQQNYPTKAVAPDGVGSRIYLDGSNLNPKTGHEMPNVRTEMENAYPGFFTPK